MSISQKKKKYKPHLKSLIFNILLIEEDDLDYDQCMDFGLSNLLYHHFMCVDKFKVNSCLNGLVEKFKYHGFVNKSKQLKECKDNFIALDVLKNHPEFDIGWSILSFLSLVAENPTSCLSDSFVTEDVQLPETSLSISTLQELDDSIDWYSYLREGDEKYQISFEESLDEWSDDEKNEQTESKLSDSESADVVTVYEKCEQPGFSSVVPTINQMPSIFPRNDSFLSTKFQGTSKQFFNQLVHRKGKTLEWLKSNVQNTWWNDPSFRQIPQCKGRDAQLAILWEKFTQFEERLNIISEYKLLREFLWCLFVYAPNAVIFRPYYSLASVRPDTLQGFLLKHLQALAFYREMSSFHSLLLKSVCSQTLRVYANALVGILRPLSDIFVRMERSAKENQSKITLIQVNLSVDKHIQDVRYMYHNIHAHVTKNWRDTAHHLQAHNVLQVLFHHVQEASSSARVSICTSLLVQCLNVSLEAVDILLSEGRVYDPSNEFFLVSSKKDDIKVRVPFPPSGCHPSPKLRSYYEECEASAHSFMLVARFGKLVELQGSIDNMGNLYTEFVQILKKKFPRPEETNVEDEEQHEVAFELLDTHDDVETTISSVLLDLIQARKHLVTSFIKKQLLEDYNLFRHLQVLYRVLLIDTEYPYITVYKYILQSSQSDLDWGNVIYLSQMLEDCLNIEFPQFSSQFTISIADEDCESNVFELINLLIINFKVGIPLDLILTPTCMAKYNLIFRFILKIKWALSLVQGLYFRDIADRSSPIKQKLHLLRHSLLHIICTMQSHFMCLLLQIFTVDLQRDLLCTYSMDTLIQVHERHLTTALFHCLLLPKQSPLQQGLNKILCLSETLHTLWNSSSNCTMKNLESLELKYMKVTWNFTELLRRSIPSSSHQVYNSISDLWSCVVSSSPAHNLSEDLDE